jgi:Family of unknown function (DUF5681)
MIVAVNNNSRKQRGRPFAPGTSGNPNGRPKGSRNRRTAALVDAAQASGEMPLDFLLRVMRDDALALERRIEAAKAAAPYCHAKLSSIEFSPPPQGEERTTAIRVEFVVPPKYPPLGLPNEDGGTDERVGNGKGQAF